MGHIQNLIFNEEDRQIHTIELIASENFVSRDIREAVGSCLTNKYAEGYPSRRKSGNRGRYYGGCAFVDEIEEYCCRQWKRVFCTGYHVNVQPHSGSNANLAAYLSLLEPGDKILAMGLNAGGHLTHGSPANFSGKLFRFEFYGVREDGRLDQQDVIDKAMRFRPRMIVAGASAYSREIDFGFFRQVADKVGAYLMVDMSHIAGLVAADLHCSPFDAGADIVTTTTHKTLRGPRGALIFCKPELAKWVDSAVFPGTQGGPLVHIIAGKAICAEEALTEEYRDYIKRVVENSKVFARKFMDMGYKVVTGGTDNHMFLIDLTDIGVSGLQVQTALDKVGISVNKNCVPGEKRGPKETSGIRLGTAAMTTKGWGVEDFELVAEEIDGVIRSSQ